MDHYELVAELPIIERLTPAERIQLAKQRRTLQILKYNERHGDDADSAELIASRSARIKFLSSIALLEATSRNDLEEVKGLLNNGVDPNVCNEDGLSALHQCAIDNNEQLLLLLINYGANVNARDTELWTPLHAAGCCGHIKIVRHLVENGAELLAVNSDGNMPYDICDDEETLDYIESEMAKRGVTQDDIDEERLIYEKRMLQDIQWLFKSGKNFEYKDEKGATPLHIAGAKGYYTVVKYLLEVGASVHVRDNDGWQPIHAAACWAQPDSIELLVSFGADINARTPAGETPFELCEDESVRAVIMTLQVEQRRRLLSFARDSRRMSKRRKPSSKFESPNQGSNTECHRLSASRGAIRRHSLRDRAGVTLARLEARREAALLRSYSFDGSTMAPLLQNGLPDASEGSPDAAGVAPHEPTEPFSNVSGPHFEPSDQVKRDQPPIGGGDFNGGSGNNLLLDLDSQVADPAAALATPMNWSKRTRKLSKTRAKTKSAAAAAAAGADLTTAQQKVDEKMDLLIGGGGGGDAKGSQNVGVVDYGSVGGGSGDSAAKSITLIDLKRIRSEERNVLNNNNGTNKTITAEFSSADMNSNDGGVGRPMANSEVNECLRQSFRRSSKFNRLKCCRII